MNEKIKQGTKIIFFLSLSALLLYLAFREVDLASIFIQIKSARYSWLILSFSFAVLSFFSRARRWILIIRPLGYNPGLWNTYHSLMTGYLVNFGLPRVGEFTRCVALGRKEKIPVDKLFGTVVAERAFDFISLIVILLLMLILRNDLMSSFLKNEVLEPIQQKLVDIFGFSALFLIIAGTLIIVGGYGIFHFRENLSKLRFIRKIGGFFSGILNGLKGFLAMKNRLEFIFHTLFIWLNYMLMTWVVVFMIPATENLNIADAIFLLVIGSLGMSAPVQGGIGAYHWIVSRGLNVVYGISKEDGLVYATLSHESQMIFIAVLGAISIFKIFGRRKSIAPPDQTTIADGKE